MNQILYNKSCDPALEKRLDDILNSLYWFHTKEVDYSLERLEIFLQKLDNPHLKLPPVIHAAGTNGKGSTLAALRNMLEASGKKVHVYTSPHLVHPTERIRLAGKPISTKMLIDILEECIAVNDNAPITFFEIFTAAVFLVMSRHPANYVLLETGMGGRLDATNIIPNPICTIITTISKDHSEFLGNTLDKIAFEKAGIMKAGVPCVIGYQTDEAIAAGVENVFHKQSQNLSPVSPTSQYGSDFKIETNKEGSQFISQDDAFEIAPINLVGRHQKYNVATAIEAYRIIMGQKFDATILSPTNKKNPLGTIFWPGRLQKITSGRLFDIIKPNQDLWIDGGHNDSAGKFLAAQIKIWGKDNRPLILIIAMVKRKNVAEFIKPLLPYATQIICTQIPNESQSYKTKDLYEQVKQLDPQNLDYKDTIEEALKNIDNPNARILATGSLYFMGNLLKN